MRPANTHNAPGRTSPVHPSPLRVERGRPDRRTCSSTPHRRTNAERAGQRVSGGVRAACTSSHLTARSTGREAGFARRRARPSRPACSRSSSVDATPIAILVLRTPGRCANGARSSPIADDGRWRVPIRFPATWQADSRRGSGRPNATGCTCTAHQEGPSRPDEPTSRPGRQRECEAVTAITARTPSRGEWGPARHACPASGSVIRSRFVTPGPVVPQAQRVVCSVRGLAAHR